MPQIPGNFDVQCGGCGVPRGRPGIKWMRLVAHSETIIDLHRDGWSASWIAKLFAVSPTLMLNFLKDNGVQPRAKNPNQIGDGHWAYKGGRLKPTKQGYIRIALAPDDLLYEMCETGRNYVLEHRYVMARSLGRPLRCDETVHHKNGKKDDNRVENLQLMVGAHHAGITLGCADCGSHNIIYQEIG